MSLKTRLICCILFQSRNMTSQGPILWTFQFYSKNTMFMWNFWLNFLFPDSASLGAALRAAHGWLCNKKGSFVPISIMYKDKLEKTSLACKLSVAAGDQQLVSKYGVLMKKRIEIENRLVQKFGRCWNCGKAVHILYRLWIDKPHCDAFHWGYRNNINQRERFG